MFKTISKLDFNWNEKYYDLLDLDKKKGFEDAGAGDVVCDGNLIVIEKKFKLTSNGSVLRLECIDEHDKFIAIERNFNLQGDIV